MFQKLKKNLKNRNEHTLEVFRKSLSSSFVKASGMIISLAVSVALGRNLGADGVGIINLANRIGAVLLIIIVLGLPIIIVKEIAIAFEQKKWIFANSVFKTSLYIVTFSSIVFVTIGVLLTPILVNQVFHEPELRWPLYLTFFALIPQSFSRVFQSCVNGFRKIWQSNLVNETLSAGIVGFLILILKIIEIELTVINVAWIYASSRLIVSIVIGIYWLHLLPKREKTEFVAKRLLGSSYPLLFASTARVLSTNADILVLGVYLDVNEIGLYAIASRVANITSFFLNVSNSSISPKLSHLYADKKLYDMRLMTNHMTSALALIAVGSSITFYFFGREILGVWGEQFSDAYWILIILSAGQFVNVATGCCTFLLTMCGLEKTIGKISFAMLLLNICLVVVLTKYWGVVGAAISTSITVSISNIVKTYFVKKHLGFTPIPSFPWIRK